MLIYFTRQKNDLNKAVLILAMIVFVIFQQLLVLFLATKRQVNIQKYFQHGGYISDRAVSWFFFLKHHQKYYKRTVPLTHLPSKIISRVRIHHFYNFLIFDLYIAYNCNSESYYNQINFCRKQYQWSVDSQTTSRWLPSRDIR